MIGFFVNTLALRSDLEGNPSFSELLGRVKQTTLEGYDHQLVPFEKVVEKVVSSRDMSMTPLFQVMFVLQNTPEGSGEIILDDVEISSYGFETSVSKFDLTFTISEGSNGIALDMVYCTDLFDKATIDRMLLHYQGLLSDIVRDLHQPIGSLRMLTSEEEHQLLDVFNDTTVGYPKDKTIIELFEEQVMNTPDAVAVVYDGEELSYRELNERSNQLGRYLRDQGVQADTLVGICLERSLEMLVGILGILKSGAAYVPIDPDYPQDRISYMVGDAGMKQVLSSSSSHKVLEQYGDLSVVLLDTDLGRMSNYSTENLSVAVRPSDLAYVIYTSGSTGNPKGVMNEHGGVVNRLLWTQSEYRLTAEDSIVQKTSFSFDVSVWELLWSVTCGAKLVFAKPEGHKDALYLKELIEGHNITTIHFVPSMLGVFLGSMELGDCPSLQRVLCSGEALQMDHVNLFKEKFRNVRLDNLYGPTEAAIDVSSWEVPLEGDLSGVSIGKPVANTRLYVLDEDNGLVPLGVTGELCIGGIQVARGYLNREELTAERFIANPFAAGDRIYKTGDLARWLPDGNIEYIGRKDNQVKIRGYRIELGEIENALSLVAGISQCCVLAKEDASGNIRLVGYVVSEEKLDKTYLQDQLKSSLPEYMVPMIWVELDQMPLTSNGKLDRKSLPEPESSDLSTKEYVAPRTEREEQLAAIWQNLLGIEKVGIHDNFFELGGHSLLAVQLISRLQKLDFHIGVKDIFAGPTIALMSERLSSLSLVYRVPENGIGVDGYTITPSMVPLVDLTQSELDHITNTVIGGVSNIQDIYPLSPLQEGIYFHHLMSDPKAGDPYVLPRLLCFSDACKRDSFIEALQFVVDRHDVLRTCVLSSGLPGSVQVVLREAPLFVEHLELDGSKSVLSQLDSLTAPGVYWMDVSKAPLLELKSADDVDNGCHYLIVYQHHLIIDHVGMEKIISEIRMYLSGKGDSLGVPVLYRDFIGHTLHAQRMNDGETYFKTLLGGIEEPTYPFELSNVLGDGRGIEESHTVLSKELSKALRKLVATHAISPAVLFHAAYGLVVARCSNREYAVFGSLFSGRLQGSLGAADSLGLFINTLPVLVDLKGSVWEYIDQVKVLLGDLLSYEQTPLSVIQGWSGIGNDKAFFSALLNYRHSGVSLPEEDSEEFDSGITILGGHERTNYPFTLSVDDFGDDFAITAQIEASIGSDRILVYMENALEVLLEGLKNEELNINALSILSEEESHQLLDVFNDTTVGYPKDKTIIELFEEQVMNTPDAVAVVYEGEELSYRELNERSNQLGRYLGDQGVQADTLVGICLERSLEMLVGILGILKSGAAYVPIDPDYPQDRISYMVGDAGMKQVLSSSSSHKVLEQYGDLSVVLLDTDLGRMSNYSTENLSVAVSASDLAYVIYTSGSTGNPKGVMNEHGGIVNRLLWSQSEYRLTSEDSIVQKTSFSFDVSVWELLWSVTCGAKLVFAKPEGHKDALYLKELIEGHNITTIHFVPSMLGVFLGSMELGDCPSLQRVLCSGEALQMDHVNLFKEKFRNVRLDNLYGPTEAAIEVSWWEVPLEGDLSGVSIGKPVANTRLYVLDEDNGLVPLGVTGELCIGGIQVARGYLNREELTAERFIANPFAAGDRIYKTEILHVGFLMEI
ncbi:non-ribosomal peptide synthetase [Flavobacterium anhuiense]|uniref:non-ribosomal peptide synthetase n=1 Tax=Flavobacterium anhuiense TaxID=459526 RepID=UPI0011A50D03